MFGSFWRFFRHDVACGLLIGSVLLSLSPYSMALEIVATGLFNNGAVLGINGQQRMLKVGKRSPEGVLLVSASPEQAVVEVDGQRLTLTLSRRINSDFSVPEKQSVIIPMLRNSYPVGGKINGRAVEMVVDTGAMSVAMNSREAQRLGIRYYQAGKSGQVRTASGLAEAYYLMFDSVEVGGLALHHVPGVVIIGDYPKSTLLGMSYLQRVSMREENGSLILEQK